VPLTPPLSPKPAQNIANIDSITIDDECTAINPDQSENNEMKNPSNIIPLSTLMDVDSEPLEADSPAPRPQRLLEDEKVHLQRSGIKLADFEVRGTLGKDFS
jgi:protein kinase A